MKAYAGIFRIRFINILQYRAAALAGLATQFAWGFMEIFAFAAFYRSNPEAFPMAFSQTASYIWMRQAFLALFVVWFWEPDIVSSIESGSISYELVRPLDLYNRWFSQSVAGRLARAMMRCAPILLVAFMLPEPYRMTLPPSLWQIFLYLFSTALSLGVVVAFSMLMYTSLFYTIAPVGVRYITATVADFLSGGYIPLPFFPEAIRKVVDILPFAAMFDIPARIYNGHLTGADAARGIGLQIIWLVALWALGRIAINRALRKVIVQGG
jgi:ABC-2 type transport system permease protein